MDVAVIGAGAAGLMAAIQAARARPGCRVVAFDGARTLARIQEQDVKDRLLKNTEGSVARGTFGAPPFFVGDEIFFGKDRLRDVEDEITAQSGR